MGGGLGGDEGSSTARAYTVVSTSMGSAERNIEVRPTARSRTTMSVAVPSVTARASNAGLRSGRIRSAPRIQQPSACPHHRHGPTPDRRSTDNVNIPYSSAPLTDMRHTTRPAGTGRTRASVVLDR
ncbi:hypothetical protein [Streptomyces turgidiscabies]|uniref:Uncharacterized protein n=1 Tax=Streptomyces turgidiscabies TaxID=85558 RepID=A0ABU0RQS4_9ACTN|nr:hypothetical protein [Streptomyces turgidiscabies]MDQ0934332.1 hypothetical protein [Streptomyces turgidiscabies]